MADSTKETLKQKFNPTYSIYKFQQIRKDISQENVTELSKDRLQECCKELQLKVAGEKKELIGKLAPLGKFPELFTKKVKHIKEYTFKASLNPSEIPAATAKWKVLGQDQHVNIPKVDDSTIKEYQQAKFAGGKGHYWKAYKMFSSR